MSGFGCNTCVHGDLPITDDICRGCKLLAGDRGSNYVNAHTQVGGKDHRETRAVVNVVMEKASTGGSLPDDAKAREQYPMAGGLLDYFPNALAEVAKLSHMATQQHHSDQPMHWDRSKSRDHPSKIIRHLIDRGGVDDKGLRHSAMVAWRALAMLQEEIEEQEGIPMSRASRTGMPSNPDNMRPAPDDIIPWP